ncbi:MAG: putative UDP-glucose 4-epimerase [Pedobacter sp.]|nr:putative UDP-glucose 4-epimerase [Pedobacter sp.]
MENVIVIGATGGTGMYLTKYLSDKNYRVYTTGQHPRDSNYFNYPNVSYQPLDITKKSDFASLPSENIDCVVLLAGMMPARMQGYDPYRYIDVNITGTLNVLEFCRENNIKKVIFTQSHADVFKHWDTGNYIAADAQRTLHLKGDHAMYIISKCTAVDMLEHYHQEFGFQTIILRLPTIYSYMPAATMYVDGKIQDMACMYMIDRATQGKEIEIWGDPSKSKDIVYIKDFISIVEAAVASKTAQGIFNVGTGIPTTLEEQILGIIEVFSPEDNRSKVVYRPEKKSQTSYLYDISRTEKELNYKVEYSYIKMLQDMKKEMLEEHRQPQKIS